MWNTFTATLQQLQQQYEEIRALQDKKRGVLVALDMEGLASLTAQEELLATRGHGRDNDGGACPPRADG